MKLTPNLIMAGPAAGRWWLTLVLAAAGAAASGVAFGAATGRVGTIEMGRRHYFRDLIRRFFSRRDRGFFSL
jgi:hypothetical protein